ncbi:MAG: thioredoxin family protein [Bacteroidia bacterium]|nr:thioredoxin family protein [Bacteroidia bacterium]NNJ55379.1 thioredoxin family protein [Bacteroidia bacterium]
MKFNYNIEERNSYSYPEYRELINSLLSQRKTTGTNHSDDLIKHTEMNVVRLNRLDKRATLREGLINTLANAPKQHWVIIAEAWCGDAAQSMPWINKMTEMNSNIKLSIILRDENTDIMDDFLTNNGRSIPKLIAHDGMGDILFDWGPRPNEIQEEFLRLKAQGIPYQDVSTVIHTLYAKNKGNAIQDEFNTVLKKLINQPVF